MPTHLRRVFDQVDTPALVLDERAIAWALRAVAPVRTRLGGKVLYALKPLAVAECLRWMAPHVDGFAASSLFEATLARDILGDRGTVHLTTPGLRPDEVGAIGRLCDHVAFNSLSQLQRLGPLLPRGVRRGLRVNPGLPFVPDDRYNPCRKHSKLGAPLDPLVRAVRRDAALLRDLDGLHFHTNCDADDFGPLLETVRRLADRLEPLLARVSWVNLGGGYLFDAESDLSPLGEAIDLLTSRFGVEVFVEPGASLTRAAGYLVASVIDLFASDGRTVAVLDTTVNHMPEVFEYQFAPDVLGDHEEGEFEYLLAGGTCLAGDVFGEYGFDEPLRIGSRVVFPDVGAYTEPKSHMFNGINLPSVYTVTRDGHWTLRRRFTYEDYARRCGVERDAAV